MKKIFERVNKNSIVAGLVSSIMFIYFLDPILQFLGKFTLILYQSLSSTLYDRLFKEIAIGKPDYSYTLLKNLLILMIVASANSSLLFIFIAKSGSSVESDEKGERLINNDNTIKKHILSSKGFRFALTTLSIIIVVVGTVSMVLSEIKITTIQTFDQRIRIVSPYIDVHAKDVLISDFSKMRGHADFLSIQKRLDSIANRNHIVFPTTTEHLF